MIKALCWRLHGMARCCDFYIPPLFPPGTSRNIHNNRRTCEASGKSFNLIMIHGWWEIFIQLKNALCNGGAQGGKKSLTIRNEFKLLVHFRLLFVTMKATCGRALQCNEKWRGIFLISQKRWKIIPTEDRISHGASEWMEEFPLIYDFECQQHVQYFNFPPPLRPHSIFYPYYLY